MSCKLLTVMCLYLHCRRGDSSTFELTQVFEIVRDRNRDGGVCYLPTKESRLYS
jgi:hypothetical protein